MATTYEMSCCWSKWRRILRLGLLGAYLCQSNLELLTIRTIPVSLSFYFRKVMLVCVFSEKRGMQLSI